MTNAKNIVAADLKHVWHPFTQAGISPDPVPISHAKGTVLYSHDGREILDMISSWWVTLHGHAHPKIVNAIAEQAGKLEQVIFGGFTHQPAVTLIERLSALLPDDLDRAFFSDDGSTAVEISLKLAHQYWRNLGKPERCQYLAFEGGYHGDTVGAMSLGSSSGLFAHWQNMMFPVTMLPYPQTWQGDPQIEQKEAEALAKLDEHLARQGDQTAALIMEPLCQGASGMRMCRPEFLRAVAEKIRAAEVLLIYDEVMTGFGRTGELFACQKAGVTPDMICLSKGLTGGFLPMSLTICREQIFQAFLGDTLEKAFAHGHSFTANPLACAASLASLDLLLDEETTRRRLAIEAFHTERLFGLPDHPRVTKRRVLGTIAAFNIECDDAGYASKTGPRLRDYFMEHNLLVRPLGNVVYLLPPYCTTDDQLNRTYDVIEQAMAEII